MCNEYVRFVQNCEKIIRVTKSAGIPVFEKSGRTGYLNKNLGTHVLYYVCRASLFLHKNALRSVPVNWALCILKESLCRANCKTLNEFRYNRGRNNRSSAVAAINIDSELFYPDCSNIAFFRLFNPKNPVLI
jgi:hypothetical protein